MLDYVLFAICAVIFLVLTILYLMPGSRRQTTIPGPDVIDELEGHIPDIKASGSLPQFLAGLHEEYGDITAFNLGPTFCVSIASPELFKEQAKVFDRPKALFELFEPLMKPLSIQYANSAEGRKRHAMFSRCFTHDSMRYYMDTLCKFSKEFCADWEKQAEEEHLGLSQYMNAFAVKAILALTLGQFFESNKEVLEFKKCYDITWREMESRLSGDAPDPAREAQFDKSREKMYGLLLKAYEQAKNNQLPEIDHKRFVDELISQEVSDDMALSDMVTCVVAGFHTTGLLLTWAVYYMASHPDVQDKVYTEMREVLGDETITIEAVDHLKYTRQVLNETLRCSQLAPFAARFQEFDTELGGHKIPAGTPVIQAFSVVLQDERIWPDPDLFDPERLNEENMKDLPAHAFEPFGFAGKRKCPGYRLSYVESTVMLSEIVRKFKINLVEGQVVQKVYGLVTKPEDEIWVTLEPRK